MSNIYATEPVTRGKVVVSTTVGDIDIELWTLEAKKACRNFIQLCLEGYYDNTIFHRIIKDFIVQGGDPTGTGTGGESIYGEPFADEMHSRLRFSHRGIVAMASSGKNMNQSQFFITLSATPELNGKNTIFGKVVGDTIFNVLRMNDFPVDGDDRPLYPPKILSTEVLLNPFDDIVPREIKKKPQESETKEPKAKQPVAKRDMKVLSFGEEAEEEVPTFKKPRMKSSHFFEDNPDGQPAPNPDDSTRTTTEDNTSAAPSSTTTTTTTPTTTTTTTTTPKPSGQASETGENEEMSVGEIVRAKMNKRKRTSGVISAKKTWNVTNDGEDDSSISVPTIVTEEEKKKKEKEEIIREQKRLKKSIQALKKTQTEEPEKEEAKPELTLLQQQRLKYKKRGKKDPAERERETLAKLAKFTASLKKDDAEWKGHQLKFPKEAGVMKEEEELYSVFDPLLKKGKSDKPKMSLHKRRLTQTGEVEKW